MGLFKKKIPRIDFLKNKAKSDKIFALSYVRELLRTGRVKEAERFEKFIEGENLVYVRYLLLTGDKEKAFVILSGMVEKNPFMGGVLKLYFELASELGLSENMEWAKNMLMLLGYLEGRDDKDLVKEMAREDVIVIDHYDEGVIGEPLNLESAKYYFEQCLFDEAESILERLALNDGSEELKNLLDRVKRYRSYLSPKEPE
ncbi:MAG: hypothetical protein ACPLSJ_04760 [Thermosulfidibacteraceae bacterium]|jgi:hypothetical protein